MPTGGSASILQSAPNSMAVESMQIQMDSIIAEGARLVSGFNGTKTATETNRNEVIQDSILLSTITNIEQAYTNCFEFIELFSGSNNYSLEINKKFKTEQFNELISASLSNDKMLGTGSLLDVFNYKQKTGMIDTALTFEQWQASIDEVIV
jgi:hypothetical protein